MGLTTQFTGYKIIAHNERKKRILNLGHEKLIFQYQPVKIPCNLSKCNTKLYKNLANLLIIPTFAATDGMTQTGHCLGFITEPI